MPLPNPVRSIRRLRTRNNISRRVRGHLKLSDLPLRTFRPRVVENLFREHPELLDEIARSGIEPDRIARIIAEAKHGASVEDHLRDIRALLDKE